MGVSIKGLGALTAMMKFSLAAGAAFAADLGDCGHPVPHRSIPACSLHIERGGALPERLAEFLMLRGTAYMIKGDNDQAIKDLGEAIRLNPNDAEGFFGRGGAYYKKGEYERAMADYDQASWLNPDHLGAYVARGDVYAKLFKSELGEGDAAFGVLERSFREGSAEMEQRSPKYWQRVEERFTLLDEAISRNPKNAEAYFQRASAYRNSGKRQYDRALVDYNQVIRLDGKHVKAYVGRAVIHHAKGQYDLAIADLDQVIRAHQDETWPLLIRAIVYEHKGDYDRAIAHLTEAIRVVSLLPPLAHVSRDAGFYSRRGLAHERKGERDKAIADYRKAIPQHNKGGDAFAAALESVKGLRRLGADLSDFPLFDEAQEVARFTGLIQQYPKNQDYYRGRCSAYNKKREYDRAIDDCSQAILLTSADPQALTRSSLGRSKLASVYNQRGIAYRNKADLERAIREFDQAIHLKPSIAEHHHNRGQLQAEWRDYDRAIEDYILAIRLNPAVAEYYDSRGLAYERKGDREKATADFGKSRQIRESTIKEPLLVPP